MCTLIVGFQPGAATPLWVAANRDELLARPATGPRWWPGEDFWAPRDEVGGGSWLGLTSRGLFVGVTNRFGAEKDDTRASRGTLVVEALRAPDAQSLHARLAPTPARRFNAFHLLYADLTHAFVTWSDGEVVRQSTLLPGVHIVTERSLGGDDRQRTEHVRTRLEGLAKDGGAPAHAQLEALLKVHDPASPVGGTCVHVPEWGYGTRSSLVLQLSRQLAQSNAFWADGPPCTTPFMPVLDLAAQLLAG